MKNIFTPTTPEIDPKTGLHILRGKIIESTSYTDIISIWCPHCLRHHTHGWPNRTSDSNHLEHRQAHCGSAKYPPDRSPYYQRGYMIGIKPKTNH